MRHFPLLSHSFPRTVCWQAMQAGHVPHHKACSGLDESLNYLIATVGAFRRCHLLSQGETGWLTGYTYSRGMNQTHSRCSSNEITGGILCNMTSLESPSQLGSKHSCVNNSGYININGEITLNPLERKISFKLVSVI